MVVFDNRGTGLTDKPDFPYTMDMMADDAVGLLDIIGIDAAHICGASMGGYCSEHCHSSSTEGDKPDSGMHQLWGYSQYSRGC